MLTALFFGLFLVSLGSFDYMPWWVSGILSTTLFIPVSLFVFASGRRLVLAVRRKIEFSSYVPHTHLRHSGFDLITSKHFRFSAPEKRYIVIHVVLLIFFLVFWFWFCWALSHACVSFFPTSISTRASRWPSGDVCRNRDPCHVYLTVGRDLANEVILHVHSSHKYGNLTIALSAVSRPSATTTADYSWTLTPQEYEVTELETQRVLYYTAISNLTADTIYYFRVVDSSPREGYNSVFTQEYNFLTGPVSGATSNGFNFVTGGDMGVSEGAAAITGVAAAQNPLFVALGGDLAYDNSYVSAPVPMPPTFLIGAFLPGSLLATVVGTRGLICSLLRCCLRLAD